MEPLALFFALLFLTVLGFILGKGRAVALSGQSDQPLHSQLPYYGLYTALWCGLPSLLVMTGWIIFESQIVETLIAAQLKDTFSTLSPEQLALYIDDVVTLASGGIINGEPNNTLRAAANSFALFREISYYSMAVVAITISLLALFISLKNISPNLKARNQVEKVITIVMMISSLVAILTTVGIIFSLIFETVQFFDQGEKADSFGILPLLAGTMLITFISMIVAIPVGLMSAIYISEYAERKFRKFAKSALEILAGIPTVVYGVFAVFTVAPFFHESGTFFGLSFSSQSALAAGVVMGIMIIPQISILSEEVLNSVPQSLKDASYALGATKSETITKIIIPAALPGIMGAVLLAMSRAIGETMIVVMAVGLSVNLSANPQEVLTTLTAQIVTLLTSDLNFDSATLTSAFTLGLLLFIITLAINILALKSVHKFREKYD